MNKYVTGWMTPEGKFFECVMYDHIHMVSKIPELKRFVPDMDEYIDRLKSIDETCCEDNADDGCPCWHNYTLAEMDISGEIRELLLNAGCMRVGSIPSAGTMHFEGRASLVTTTKLQAAYDLAENYDMNPVFEDV
jgi:hypothetical protein